MEIEGVITKVEIKTYPNRESGRAWNRNTSINDLKLRVEMEASDNNYWFFTPATQTWVTGSMGAYVACVHSNDWITEGDEYNQQGALNSRLVGHAYKSRVQRGDVVKIKGKIKADTRDHIHLWYVRRLDFSFKSIKKDWQKRVKAAKERLPVSVGSEDSPASEPPVAVPGVKWRSIGHMGNIYEYRRCVTDDTALVSWHERRPAQRPAGVLPETD